jgi:hypothetical protein
MKDLSGVFRKLSDQSSQNLEQLKKADQPDRSANQSPNAVNFVEDHYYLNAKRVSVTARAASKDGGTIWLNAAGDDTNGNLILRASDQTVLAAGDGGIVLTTAKSQGRIIIDCGKDAANEIVLLHGKVHISISKDGITISGNDQKVAIESRGAIEVSSKDSVTLKAGDNTSLKLSPVGGLEFRGPKFDAEATGPANLKGIQQDLG